MGKSKILTRAQGVMDAVTYERAEELLLPFAFLQREAGLGECLSCPAFPQEGFPQASLLVQT